MFRALKTNIMAVTAPYRHDLITSCINNEVQIFNRKLHKTMGNKDNVTKLDHETNREDFTQHGLHLNASGKGKVMKLMSQNTSAMCSQEETSYHFKMKNYRK